MTQPHYKAKYHPTLEYFYFMPKQRPRIAKWAFLRSLAKDYPPGAQKRLEWVIFYETVGKKDATYTSSYFNISRKTFHKWYKLFNESKCNIESLSDKSKRPKNTRKWEVTTLEEERIIKLRKDHLKYGKRKLKKLYTDEYKENISTWKIERVIRKHNLYPNREAQAKRLKLSRAQKLRPKKLIKDFKREDILGFLWHLDTIIMWWYGETRVIFTALEDISKIAYARVYKSKTSGNAKDFLDRLRYVTNNQVLNSHQDNGSEFEAKFSKACEELKINQVFSRPRTPKDNPSLERFNWTVQDEWLSMSEIGLDDIDEANKDLTEWLIEYNFKRPHESLSLDSPIVYAQKNYQVSPMWSACTKS